MTNPDPDRVYRLLPAIYQLRDQALGTPLRQLLSAIEADLQSLESDIGQLYDDMFIETCQGPLIDRFAELVAVNLPPLTPAQADPGGDATAWVSRRHQVVNAIAARAAKGTLAALERTAADATGWPVRAVEDGLHVAITQPMTHPNRHRGRLFDTYGDAPPHTYGSPRTGSALADVRRGDSTLSKPVGPHPTTVTLTVWRQEVSHVHRAPAACVDDDSHYTFDALGYDRQLAVAPTPRRPGAPPAGVLDLPMPISRHELHQNLADYYGADRSLCVYRGRTPVPAAEIVVADLSGWATDAGYGQVVVDPQTGRIDFPPTEETEEGVWVRYHHLGVGAIGAGGGRDDELTAEEAASQASGCLRVIKVAVGHADESVLGSVTTAIDTWLADARTDGRVHGVIEILDSNLYEEDFDIRIGAGMQLDIRAVPGQHPVLRSVDEQHNRPKRVRVEGHPVKGEVDPPRLSLSGLTIAEHALELKGEFGRVFIDHCAIVPEHDDPDRRHLAIAITAMPCPVTITSSIIGEVRINTAEVGHDPVELSISDSILDAGPDGGRAISGADDRPGYAALSLNRATVLGEINVFQADAQDSIITGHFFSRRRQSGAIRFCYLPPMSHVPQRVSCQPDGVLARIDDDLRAGLIDAAKHQGLLISEPARVRPRFDSTGFATSGFCRLALDNAAEITHGSQDDGELGALHDLWLTRRVDDMTTRLTEFTPIGVELDIVFAT